MFAAVRRGGQMSAEDYHSRAEAAQRQALIARSGEERAAFLQIADLWRKMAARSPYRRELAAAD
jgi:hypothetical protein